ncbi:hypothetical protein SKAU_G00368210 [Synaphobranchus kaupii]|uniref:Uncharacterized protein n=1 Tax=Synaphobranchus kaupii TaxID=118154 RepID=A0A9Q1EFI2_SYNKA|nr:hypothetical protein SKAU_G00368210 [Synaphobranchus kaupii]
MSPVEEIVQWRMCHCRHPDLFGSGACEVLSARVSSTALHITESDISRDSLRFIRTLTCHPRKFMDQARLLRRRQRDARSRTAVTEKAAGRPSGNSALVICVHAAPELTVDRGFTSGGSADAWSKDDQESYSL